MVIRLALPIRVLALLMLIGQNSSSKSSLDSLKQLLQSTNDLQRRIELYAALSKSYLPVNPDSAYIFARSGLRMSDKATPPKLLGELHHYLGNALVKRDSLDGALDAYLHAEQYYRQSKSWEGLAIVHMLLGNVYYVKDKLADALSYYYDGIELAEQYKVTGILGVLELNIASVYQMTKNYQDAIHNLDLALAEFEQTGDSMNMAVALQNLGSVYNDLNELAEAEKYCRQSAEIFRMLNDHAYLSEAWLTLADISQKRNDENAARKYLETTLAEIDLIGPEYAGPKMPTRGIALSKLGLLNLNQNPAAAYGYLLQALEIGKTYDQLSVLASASNGLSLYWEKMGRSDSALFYSKLHRQYYGQQMNEDNVRELAYRSAQFEFQQQLKAKEVDRLKAQSEQRRNYFLLSLVIGVLAIASLVLFFLFKLGRSRLKQAGLEKAKLQGELEFRNKELTTHVMYQVQNKELVLNIAEKLKNNELLQHPEFKKVVKEILSEIEADGGSDAWKEFEIRFQRVHTDFYKKLGDRFPDLSANELRLCAFLKLNMSTKDIASVTYQTTNSIDVARHRLRSKLGLSKDENLVSFLSRI